MLEFDKRELRLPAALIGFLLGGAIWACLYVGVISLIWGQGAVNSIGRPRGIFGVGMGIVFGVAGAKLLTLATIKIFDITEAAETEWVCIGKARESGEPLKFSVWALDVIEAEDRAKDIGRRLVGRFKLEKTTEVKGGGRPKPPIEEWKQSIYYPGYHSEE